MELVQGRLAETHQQGMRRRRLAGGRVQVRDSLRHRHGGGDRVRGRGVHADNGGEAGGAAHAAHGDRSNSWVGGVVAHDESDGAAHHSAVCVDLLDGELRAVDRRATEDPGGARQGGEQPKRHLPRSRLVAVEQPQLGAQPSHFTVVDRYADSQPRASAVHGIEAAHDPARPRCLVHQVDATIRLERQDPGGSGRAGQAAEGKHQPDQRAGP